MDGCRYENGDFEPYSATLRKNISVSPFKENIILVASCQEEKSIPIGKSQSFLPKMTKYDGHDTGQ